MYLPSTYLQLFSVLNKKVWHPVLFMLCIEDSQSKAKRHLDSPPTILRLLQINAKDELLMSSRKTHCQCSFQRKVRYAPFTVCWIEVMVAVLCANQYMPWNQLLMKTLINFWYFKHQILTWICSEPYLKHHWRNFLLKLYLFYSFQRQIFNCVLKMLLSKS